MKYRKPLRYPPKVLEITDHGRIAFFDKTGVNEYFLVRAKVKVRKGLPPEMRESKIDIHEIRQGEISLRDLERIHEENLLRGGK